MSPELTAQFDAYDRDDPDLADAFDEVLELLERDDPDDKGHWRLRKKLIRPANAYVVPVRVRGRDVQYYLFWQPEDMQTKAVIRYMGESTANLE